MVCRRDWRRHSRQANPAIAAAPAAASAGCRELAPSTATKITAGIARERATDTPGDISPFALGLLMRRAHDRAAHAAA
jgi:hypothetical protein